EISVPAAAPASVSACPVPPDSGARNSLSEASTYKYQDASGEQPCKNPGPTACKLLPSGSERYTRSVPPSKRSSRTWFRSRQPRTIRTGAPPLISVFARPSVPMLTSVPRLVVPSTCVLSPQVTALVSSTSPEVTCLALSPPASGTSHSCDCAVVCTAARLRPSWV